ncbi:hypothetical protein RHMOL_Rhmol09G0115300 [Rhododendron molle]|uniref:Uncharacterized protein n=1 Tax=Rhododendron molle TaxID=49168 RepID=A0ACC0MCB1_RHOML|nr:hypothetical protein RHMOL_Rhmol09G0115300 [Rhododendron molle]
MAANEGQGEGNQQGPPGWTTDWVISKNPTIVGGDGGTEVCSVQRGGGYGDGEVGGLVATGYGDEVAVG